MDLTTSPMFKMVLGRMGWLSKRQEVLAQNISNADTPDHVPLDLKKQNFRSMMTPKVGPALLQRTSADHMGPIHQTSKHGEKKGGPTYEVAPSGNSVILEEQLMKVADTQGQYRLATNLYSKHVSMLKQAIGRNNG